MKLLILAIAFATFNPTLGCILDGTSLKIRNAKNNTLPLASSARSLFEITDPQLIDSGFALYSMTDQGDAIYFNANDARSNANVTINGNNLTIAGALSCCLPKSGAYICKLGKVMCNVKFEYSDISRNAQDASVSAATLVTGKFKYKNSEISISGLTPMKISASAPYGANGIANGSSQSTSNSYPLWQFFVQCNQLPTTASLVASPSSAYSPTPSTNAQFSWTSWNDWSSCSATCGNGTRQRFRSCDGPSEAYCTGSSADLEPCALSACVQPEWTVWNEWGLCSVTCGNGTKLRSRSCNGSNDTTCTGDSTESQECVLPLCAVDGAWSDWSDWDSCVKGCTFTTRNRTCSNPMPINGGKNCVDNSTQIKACFFISGCEGAWPKLQCPNGSLISMGTVKYGRWNKTTCPGNGQGNSPSFITRTIPDMMGVQSIQMPNFNSRFGDPYQNTFKHFEVTYSCGNLTIITGCEANKINATCPVGLVISYGFVLYGRWNTNNCAGNNYDQTASASWYNFPSAAIGKRSYVFSPSIFGDPRPNVYKQWTSKFICAPAAQC